MPKPPEEDAFILPDEYEINLRNKRAVQNQANQKLNVETLVVVDRKMMENHGHENITTYVLTVLNMVRESVCVQHQLATVSMLACLTKNTINAASEACSAF